MFDKNINNIYNELQEIWYFKEKEGCETMRKWVLSLSAVMVVFTTTVYAYKSMEKQVVLKDENKVKTYFTFSSTIEEFLKEQKIQLAKDDEINVAKNKELEQVNKIIIERAVPVTLVVDNKSETIQTCANTVAEILQEKGIVIGEKDVLEGVTASEPIHTGMKIVVSKYREEYILEKTSIPFTTQTVKTNQLDSGTQKVIQVGQEGLQEVKVKVSYVGNKVIKKEEMTKKIIQQPVQQIVQVGTAQTVKTSRGTFRVKNILNMKATAYTLSYYDTGKRPGDRDYGITASGMRARVGVIAVDPRVIPLGSRLYVEGYGYCIAGDTGGAIKGNRIDLFFNTSSECSRFGVQMKKVYILR